MFPLIYSNFFLRQYISLFALSSLFFPWWLAFVYISDFKSFYKNHDLPYHILTTALISITTGDIYAVVSKNYGSSIDRPAQTS